MSFKKILSLLLVFCLIFSFVACGGKGKDVDDDDDRDTKKTSTQKDKDDDDDDEDKDDKKSKKDEEDEDDKKSKEDDKDSKSSKDNSKKGEDPYKDFPEADLPKGYPSDVYPIKDGGRIWMGMMEERNNAAVFTVAVVYNEKFDAIDKYYTGIIEDAEDFDDQKSGMGNVYKGKYGGYKFEIVVMDASDGLVQVTLSLTEIPSAGSVLKSLDKAELPEGYPVDDFPIIDGGAIWNATESESNGKVYYDIDVYTDKSIKEIVKFYDEKLTNVEDKRKSSDSDSFDLGGKSNGYYYDIYGNLTTENNVQLVRYYINIDPLDE